MRFIFIFYQKIILSKDLRLVECRLCGKTIASINAIAEIIDGESYTFDGTDCALMFHIKNYALIHKRYSIKKDINEMLTFTTKKVSRY
jgi:hypothetical protein